MATAAYQEYLRSVKDLLPNAPNAVRELAEACFHDAAIVAARSHLVSIPLRHFPEPFPGPLPTFTLFLIDEIGKPICLTYFLWDEVRFHQTEDAWPFSQEKQFWLYEEMEARQGPGEMWFKHKILPSDGTVLDIPFTGAFIMREEREAATAG